MDAEIVDTTPNEDGQCFCPICATRRAAWNAEVECEAANYVIELVNERTLCLQAWLDAHPGTGARLILFSCTLLSLPAALQSRSQINAAL